MQVSTHQAGPHGAPQHEGQGYHQGAGLQLLDGVGQRIIWQGMVTMSMEECNHVCLGHAGGAEGDG